MWKYDQEKCKFVEEQKKYDKNMKTKKSKWVDEIELELIK